MAYVTGAVLLRRTVGKAQAAVDLQGRTAYSLAAVSEQEHDDAKQVSGHGLVQGLQPRNGMD